MDLVPHNVDRDRLSEQLVIALERAPAGLPYGPLARLAAEVSGRNLSRLRDLAFVDAIVDRVGESLEEPSALNRAIPLPDFIGRDVRIDRRVRALATFAEGLGRRCGGFEAVVLGFGSSPDRRFSMNYMPDLQPVIFIGNRALVLHRLAELVGSLGHEVGHITTGSGWRVHLIRAVRALALARDPDGGAAVNALCTRLLIGEEVGADDAGSDLVGNRAMLQAQLGVERVAEAIRARARAAGRPVPLSARDPIWPTHLSRAARAARIQARMAKTGP